MADPRTLRAFTPRLGHEPERRGWSALDGDQVLQIVPADGWVAMYADANGAERWHEPLAVWVLLRRHHGGRFVVIGMESSVESNELEEARGGPGTTFVGYARLDSVEGR